MIDNEIIKALECCGNESWSSCHPCPYRENRFERHCAFELSQDALDLINRQKSEIEKLEELLRLEAEWANTLNDVIAEQQAELEDLREIVFMDRTEEIKKKNKELKTEAVKEFAERLKNKIKTECNPYGKPTFDYDTSITIMRYIDNLVKEMESESNE